MEREVLERYLNDGMSLNKISENSGKSLTTIIYWKNKYQLDCHR
jgi:transposase